MENSKSHRDFYLDLVVELYRDIAQCYGVPRRMQRIEEGVILSRYATEGLSFLTKTLPRLSKSLDRALATGGLFSIEGFARIPGSVVPKFLGWLLNRVISASGSELDQPDPIALSHIRQLCTVLYKLEVPHDSETEKSIKESFIETDQALETYEDGPIPDIIRGGVIDGSQEPGWHDEWIVGARNLVTRVISGLDPWAIKPKHGPGAVATGERVCAKTMFSRIYAKLEQVYPFSEYMRFNLNHVADSTTSQGFSVHLKDEATAKVVFVPKDSRGPRLISCEPLEIQWIQQGLKGLLQDRIESHRLTKGFVNFTDQMVNRRLALAGSRGEGWVTLDMKEASDRVSLSLVKTLFSGHPEFLQALEASRSGRTRFPDGTEVALRKFAPMGSAVCFPVESLVFWALSVSAIRRSGSKWRDAIRSVYVYGDDIIVKEKDYATLLQHLPRVGLMFNPDKCCTARSFRESCGCDAYVGVDVTPSRLKTVWSPRRSNPEVLQSYVAFYNAMFGKVYLRTAAFVRSQLVEVYGDIPYTNRYITADNGAYVSQAAYPAFVCHEPAYPINRDFKFPMRFNKKLMRLEIHTRMIEPIKVRTNVDGYPEMLRRFSGGYGSYDAERSDLFGEEIRSSQDVGVYALPRRNRLKRGWALF